MHTNPNSNLKHVLGGNIKQSTKLYTQQLLLKTLGHHIKKEYCPMEKNMSGHYMYAIIIII